MIQLDKTEKNIILICKCNYDKNVYSSKYEALRGYLAECFGFDVIYVDDETVYRQLYPIMLKVFNSNQMNYFFSELYKFSESYTLKNFNKEIISHIGLLPVMNKGEIILDLSL